MSLKVNLDGTTRKPYVGTKCRCGCGQKIEVGETYVEGHHYPRRRGFSVGDVKWVAGDKSTFGNDAYEDLILGAIRNGTNKYYNQDEAAQWQDHVEGGDENINKVKND